jgi:hypothetical protein
MCTAMCIIDPAKYQHVRAIRIVRLEHVPSSLSHTTTCDRACSLDSLSLASSTCIKGSGALICACAPKVCMRPNTLFVGLPSYSRRVPPVRCQPMTCKAARCRQVQMLPRGGVWEMQCKKTPSVRPFVCPSACPSDHLAHLKATVERKDPSRHRTRHIAVRRRLRRSTRSPTPSASCPTPQVRPLLADRVAASPGYPGDPYRRASPV